jgi:hypothetical protein
MDSKASKRGAKASEKQKPGGHTIAMWVQSIHPITPGNPCFCEKFNLTLFNCSKLFGKCTQRLNISGLFKAFVTSLIARQTDGWETSKYLLHPIIG